MEEISQKIRVNALSAYFMIFVSIFFLFSKDQNINHPFVRGHVKSAFIFHLLLAGSLFVMSYDFFSTIHIINSYSVNTLITVLLLLLLFLGMLYGMHQAYKGKQTNISEMLSGVRFTSKLSKSTQSNELNESQSRLLIFAHIPFLAYILYDDHKHIAHFRDIVLINLISMLLASMFYIGGRESLASLLVLAYIIYSVFQSVRLVISQEIWTPDLNYIPDMQDLQNMLLAAAKSILHTLKKSDFIAFEQLVAQEKNETLAQKTQDQGFIASLPNSTLPSYMSYIPGIQLISVFLKKNKDIYHNRNGITLTLVFIIGSYVFSSSMGYAFLMFFPIAFALGKLEEKSYRMPFIYNIYAFFAHILYTIGHIFHRTKKLKKTVRQEKIIIHQERLNTQNVENKKTQE